MAKQRTSKLQRAILDTLQENPSQRYDELALTVAQHTGRVITYEMRSANRKASFERMAKERIEAVEAGDTQRAESLILLAGVLRSGPIRKDTEPDATFRADFSRSLNNLYLKQKLTLYYNNQLTSPRLTRVPMRGHLRAQIVVLGYTGDLYTPAQKKLRRTPQY